MKKLAILILGIVSFTFAYGGPQEETTNPVKEIENLPKKMDSSLYPSSDCDTGKMSTNLSSQNNNDNLAKCLIAVCGAPQDLSGNLSERNFISEEIRKERKNPEFDKEIRPILNRLIERSDKSALLMADSTIKFLESYQPVSNSDTALFENMKFFNSMMSHFAFAQGDPTQPKHQLDIEGTRKNLKGIPKEVQDHLLALAQEYYKSKFHRDQFELVNYGPKNYLAMNYPGLDYSSALRKDLEKLNEIRSVLIASPQFKFLEIIPAFDAEVYNKIRGGQTLSEDELEQYLKSRGMVNMLAPYVLEKDRIKTFYKNIQEENLDEKKEKVLEEIKEFKAWILDPEGAKSGVEALMNACEINYLIQVVSAQSSSDIKQANLKFEKTKERMSKYVISKFSSVSGEKMKAALQKVQGTFPKTDSEFRKKFKEELLNLEKQFSADQKPVGLNDDMIWNMISTRNPYDLYNRELISLCGKYGYKDISDHAAALSDNINVSYISVKYPKVGQGFMSHEMGHILDHTLKTENLSQESRKTYSKARSCLQQKHSSEASSVHDRFGDEDWADLIAALANPEKNGNPFCFVIGQKSKQYIQSELVQANPRDTHSSELFRALHYHKVLHKILPNACEKAIQEQGFNIDFSSCL